MPASVPKIVCDASPAMPTHVSSAAELSIVSPAGPGGAGQSWKKPLLTVTARPFAVLRDVLPRKLLARHQHEERVVRGRVPPLVELGAEEREVEHHRLHVASGP